MKLGVFNLWTEMREQPPSDAFEAAPLFQTQALPDAAAKSPSVKRVGAAPGTKKRKPVVIVDEITAS